MPDRDRRKPFTPAAGVTVLAEPFDEDKTPVDRVDLHLLRADLQAMREDQTADRKQLNGRIGTLDGRMGGVEKELRVQGTKVDRFDGKLDELLEQKKTKARKETEQIKLRRARWYSIGKVVAAVVGSGAFGLVVAAMAKGCG